jgi:hypothetical protein
VLWLNQTIPASTAAATVIIMHAIAIALAARCTALMRTNACPNRAKRALQAWHRHVRPPTICTARSSRFRRRER